MSEQKTGSGTMAEKLLIAPRHLAKARPQDVEKAQVFCEGYKEFLNKGKTERLAADQAVQLLEKAGYQPFSDSSPLQAGDKVYLLHRQKAVVAVTVGTDALEEGALLTVAHIDAPRLDLKANPLYEMDEQAYFKTHYYGGVRKYQWVAVPLAMHGVVIKETGEAVRVNVGQEAGDPVFTITDLLPHLSAEQDKRTLEEGIKGEELNILIGSMPFEEEGAKDTVKLEAMRLLNKKYGMTERDFARAEIEFVPAFPACDVGFDKSMVGAYGQDDRVCAYTILMAEIDKQAPKKTTVCVLCDKEEIGSTGNTGLAGDFLFHFLQMLAEGQGADWRKMFAASQCLSADVNAAFDPTFPDVFEKQNTCLLNHGVGVTKYTGNRGKVAASDASAEFLGQVTGLLDNAHVIWQTGELGKVDAGGGGTIAKFVAGHNIEVLDIGVPVLSMHAPFEVTSKLDIYNAYRAFLAFAQQGLI